MPSDDSLLFVGQGYEVHCAGLRARFEGEVTRITDIVDNRAADGFAAEHGLSLLIEHGDERILFDTGAGAALRPNAVKLGIDLEGVTRIVLSHSHNDHTGEAAGAKLKEMLSCPVVWGSAGSILIGR